MALEYECARTEPEVREMLRRRPALVVAAVEGLPELPVSGVAEMAQQARVPVLVVGGDTPAEQETLAQARGLYVASCRRSGIDWLPVLVERTVREQEQGRQAQGSAERCGAQQMREIQKLVTIGQLAGSIAHEINNPLEAITNLVYIVATDSTLPEPLRVHLDLAQQELERVAQISKQTLSFYRETQAPVRVMLSALMEEVLVLYARRLEEKQITLERRFESEAPVMAFPGELRQVYANLLANAIEATPAGGRLVVRIHCASRRGEGWENDAVHGVRVVIADNGMGIPAGVRERLGQAFYTTKGQRGTGLGLWVSQAILKRYGGAMQLRSATEGERRGSTFSIFMPIEAESRVYEIPAIAASGAEGVKAAGAGGLQLCASGA